ncbi:MAG: DUF1700 domain-containing protein [Lachnospiraceae bacterium]|jgi:uncharacterized membrane protein|nr:DUF1700 domain-containing protein [Lachnospiraceae bacterium]
MDKKEYLNRLQMQLEDLTNEERREALEYYEEYFADAGEENEDEVICSLGEPEQVAEQIKAGLHKEGEGMFTENGYREKLESDNPPEVYGKKEEKKAQERDGRGPLPWGWEKRKKTGSQSAARGASSQGVNMRRGGYGYDTKGQRAENADGYSANRQGYGAYGGAQSAGTDRYGYGDAQSTGTEGYEYGRAQNAGAGGSGYGTGQQNGKKSGMSGGMIALLVVLCIFAAPIILGLGVGLIGLVMGILATVIGVIVAFFAVVIALLAAGVGLFIGGFAMLFVRPFGGMICMAAGCFLIALFLVCAVLLAAVFSKFFPWLIKEVEGLGKYLSRKWAERKGKGEMA